ncbi:Selenoprotein [Plasmopara halstedii]|uniref:Selenoprotein F n=1 Tax=Plasmopara halstedii TaxID=4781 RepID=A0A0P1AX03_PLAHL|nr:Selenoprotein [Plasmopara halstedii]CEG45245.1 Selenoprotein [Plasmopara halstedii]|eukprot:XP_024581614.1 Selenoprotein [Plasmopara halstedii]
MHFVTLLVLLVASGHAQNAPESSSELPSDPEAIAERLHHCTTLGFDTDALDCRLCDELSSFLVSATPEKKKKTDRAITAVTKECRECCTDFSKVLEAEGRRYSKVALVVNRLRLKRYPKVANFLEHQAEQIKRLEVVETNPRLPMLQFFDDEGEKIEEISVAHWDENSIAEFIENKLLPEKAAETIVEMEVEAVKV